MLKSFSSLCMLKLAFSPKRFIFRASGSYIWEGEGPNSGLRGWLVIKEEREGSQKRSSMAREVRSSEVKDGRSILVKEEEESPLTELRSVGAGPEEPAPAPRRQQADQEPLER